MQYSTLLESSRLEKNFYIAWNNLTVLRARAASVFSNFLPTNWTVLHISGMQVSLAFKCAIVAFRFHLRRNALVDKADGGNSRYGNFDPCPLRLSPGGRKEVLAPQPMLFTVQYILSTLLRIPSTWENSHSFSPLCLTSFLPYLRRSVRYPPAPDTLRCPAVLLPPSRDYFCLRL